MANRAPALSVLTIQYLLESRPRLDDMENKLIQIPGRFQHFLANGYHGSFSAGIH